MPRAKKAGAFAYLGPALCHPLAWCGALDPHHLDLGDHHGRRCAEPVRIGGKGVGTLRACIQCGRPASGPRCDEHRRGTTTQRGYGTRHRLRRLIELQEYDPTDPCWRCGEPLGEDSTALHLDHTLERDDYMGLAHAGCNSGRREPGGTLVTQGQGDPWRPGPGEILSLIHI